MIIRVSIPATSANLGPGFDCFGLALNLKNIVTIEPSNTFQIILKGKYQEGIPTNESNLVWKTMLYLWHQLNFKVPTLKLTLENNIPPTRGLGSSSAAIAAGLLAANTLAGSPLTRFELVQIGTDLEGHPDNITPAFLGGVTLTVLTAEGKIIPRILASKPKVRAVAIVPDLLVKTEEARKLLKKEVSRNDAVFNVAHASLIVEAFLKEEYHLLGEAMQDRLHQLQRSPLIPGMLTALKSAIEAGAYGAALSGSGPTLLALTPVTLEKQVAASMQQSLEKHGLLSLPYFLEIDSEGAQVEIISKNQHNSTLVYQ